MISVGSDYGIPSLRELEAFMMNETPYQPPVSGAAPERRGSMGRFVLSTFERAKEVTSPVPRATSTVAVTALTEDPSSRGSSVVSEFPLELPTERPDLFVGKGIDPAYYVFRPLPGYGEWIENPGLKTPAVEAMKAEIDTVQKLVLSRGVSLHEISDTVQRGTSIKELNAQRAKRVAFASQIEEVIPEKNKSDAGCCVVQ